MNVCLVIDIDDTLYVHKSGPSRLGFMDYDNIKPNPDLTKELQRLQYPKYILSNATFGHANEILNKMDLDDEFKKIYARNNMSISKPHKECYERVQLDIMKDLNKQVDEYLFFDDLLENLKGARDHGWIPIWISPNYKEAYKHPFVYRAFPSLTEALKHI